MEKQIKSAVEEKLNQANYHPELKNQTLAYIASKSNKKKHFPYGLRQLSVFTLCSVMLMVGVAYHSFSINSKPPQQQALSNLNLPTSDRQIRGPLADTLNQLGLDHQEKVTLIEDNNITTSYFIEGMLGYEIEFTSFLYQIDVCEEVDRILSNHGVDKRPFNMIKLSEYRVFIYFEISDVLLQYFNEKHTTLLCI